MAFAFINSATQQGNASSFVCNKPTNTAEDDIMFALTSQSAAGGYPTGVPSGWTSLGQANSVSFYQLYYKVATGAEPSDYTWTYGGANQGKVTIVTYRDGFVADNPIDVTSNTPYTTDNATFRAASMTVAATNSPLIFFATGFKTSAITYTKPSVPTTGWAEDYDEGSETSDFWVEICSMVWAGSGATGTMDATGSASPESGNKHAFAVALNQPVNVTVSPSVLNATFSVQAPSVATGATVTVSAALSATFSVQAPTVSFPTPDFTNLDKSATSTFTNPDKS